MIEVKVPELAESITEGTISQWLIKVGDKVEKGDNLVELETDKVNIEVSAENDGVIKELLKEPGDNVEVGEIIAYLGGGESSSSQSKDQQANETEQAEAKKEETESPEEAKSDQESKAHAAPEANQQSENGRTVASPSARKLARELGVDLNEVNTKDPLGRVRPDDVKAHADQSGQKEAPKQEKKQEKQENKQSQANEGKPVERVKMSRRRQTIAKRLVEVQHTAAMLTTFNEVDMTAIMELRKRRKDKFLEDNDVKLGFMSFFTKAVVGALKKYPRLNAEIQDTDIVLKKFYDIGIAVGAEEGLVVPVVRDADKLSFAGIEQEIGNLAKKARDNKLKLDELQGGSFTITNGGIFGSMLSTPILNAPQVGILGMHKIQWRPMAIDQERMENRPMMYIALSYDHRIVDGGEAVSFLAKIKELLEDPEQLLLEG
ncbi:2-oxoglutarate dehydrogenase complex dihydrolipoyllysine-residue succinyltransferase [Guptibacillus hwajinpoensis]|uniref:Dihydrolipoyllysine-residue succinyltransferase component of 2-oxoglutarate dehydrogenase complex n=1 Tax=Guptibacillus hwajinpoensis TaxID=208199 RepID=A0ABU0K1E9_9BACL|nr:2-oxoglutarate dehydrogenase complex dihydrolipoyllysine-residue succinyltransferase [Alkalihalobacillus hemicentroti]MDQ0483169.1 2-oxoglutarate dehydrogenase E2 component (dihydrolipoamide succinyltransferase) [Alkalihalobacillus hemicentroti]